MYIDLQKIKRGFLYVYSSPLWLQFPGIRNHRKEAYSSKKACVSGKRHAPSSQDSTDAVREARDSESSTEPYRASGTELRGGLRSIGTADPHHL